MPETGEQMMNPLERIAKECQDNEASEANINSRGERICWYESSKPKICQYKNWQKCEYPIHRYSKMSKRAGKYLVNAGGC